MSGRPRLGIRAQETEDGKGLKVVDVADESVASKAGIKEKMISFLNSMVKQLTALKNY